jgi:hypothetical protein
VDIKESDHVLQYMLDNHIPLTVKQYVALNWWGEKCVEDLEGEDWAEVKNLVIEGKLRGKL